MKKGSGNLDFGQDDSEDKPIEEQTSSVKDDETQNQAPVAADPETESATDDAEPHSQDPQEYPYFVRRSNVGDERETRLEVHVRSDVADDESDFRNGLADALEANEISKTDAREFALKFAFENPEAVAELMREEGFGLLD